MTTAWETSLLAATKLHPPTPPAHLVPRNRLGTILDSAVERSARLALVCAPAGSGKSTLVAAWSRGQDRPTAWLQVEASDADPVRFWSALVDSIAGAAPVDQDELRSVVVGSNGDVQAVVTTLVNALAALDEPIVVVVDDYHLIDDDRVHRGVERLVELSPPTLTLVIGTRVDPPFRLGRLRVRDQLVEVRAADLRFDTDEATGLLAPSRPLDRAQVDELCARTEGWAAGLVLAGLSLSRSEDPDEFIAAFRGDDQLVVEYLRDELLAGIDPTDRRRLLETSVLDELTGPLVDAVTAGTGGAGWLLELARSNQLVIGLDRTGTWFRYHHLLRDLLRLEAAPALADDLPEIHRRAAAWFEAQGDLRRAILHRIDAGDLDPATRLLLILAPKLLANGQITTLQGLLDRLGDRVRTVSWLTLLAGWSAFITGEYGTAEQHLATLRAHDRPRLDPAIAMPLDINLCLARGDVAAALDRARRMAAADQIRSRTSDLATATGAAYAWAGRADDARRDLRLAVDKGTHEQVHTAHVLALVYQAVVEREHGTVPVARAAAATALDTAHRFGLGAYHGIAPTYAIRGALADDRIAGAADLHQALALARRASTDLVLGFVLTTCGDALAELGDPEGTTLLAEARSVLARCPDPGIVGRALARAESRHRGPVLADARARPSGLIDPLTDRELAVLGHLPSSRSQREIAAELYVSLNTVKTHCRAIYRKLGVSDRKAAVQAARDQHLL